MKTTVLNLALLFGVIQVVSAQTTLNMSQDLVRLGIASSNMAPNQPSLDAGPLFMQAVEYAKSHSIATVIADPGTYYFLSVNVNTHVALGQINNMTIDFQGADLIFTHPLFYGIVVYTSTNAVLQNFTVDNQPLPFTQVRVVAVDVANSQIQYAVQPGWQDPSAFNAAQVPQTDPPPVVQIHIFRSRQPVLGRLFTQFPLSGNFVRVVNTSAAILAAVRPGDIAVIAMNAASGGINTNHCQGCTLRNITVYSCASGGAPVGASATQSALMERIYAIPKPGTDRLVSTFSAVYIGFAGPNNRIRLSRSIRSMDDSFWFWGRVVGTVQNQIGSRSLTASAATAWTVLGDNGDSVPNGSPVTFQRPSDGLILGSAIIVSQTAKTSSQPPQATFTFDRDLPSNLVGSAMYTTDANLNGANSVLERSTVQSQSCCKGTYFAGLANSTVRGNYIRRPAWAGIFAVQGMTPGDPPVAPVVNLGISNNVIDGANAKSDWWWFELGAIQAVTLTNPGYLLFANSVFSNINVTNNFIADSGRSAVWIGNTTGGSVSGNYILDANARPNLANTYPAYTADATLPLVGSPLPR